MSISITYCCDECGKTFPKGKKDEYISHLKKHSDIKVSKIALNNFKKHTIYCVTGKTVSEVEQFMLQEFTSIIYVMCHKEIAERCGLESQIDLNLQYLDGARERNKKKFTFYYGTFTNDQTGSEYYVINMTDSKVHKLALGIPRYKINVGDGILFNVYDEPMSMDSGCVVLSMCIKKGKHEKIDIEKDIFG